MATKRITAAFVQTINHQLTGNSVVVKPNELESALARPIWKQKYDMEASPSALAASLAFGIILDHPFMDGNKRTAFWVANEYLKDVGTTSFTQDSPDAISAARIMVEIGLRDAHERVASGNMDEAGLANEYRRVLGF